MYGSIAQASRPGLDVRIAGHGRANSDWAIQTRRLLTLQGLLGLTAPATVSCGHLAVQPTNPKPNVMVAAEKAPSALVLSPSIGDAFIIPKTGSVNEVPVTGWRVSKLGW